jgi:hypothetical protein
VAVQSKPARPSAPAPRRRAAHGVPIGARRSTEAVDAAVTRTQSGALPTTSPTILRRRPHGGASPRGDELLLVFFGATMVMVAAVVLVGAAGQMWVLVPVMLVDLTVTFAVIGTLVSMLGGDGGPSA